MMAFAMAHEILTFLIILVSLGVVEQVVVAFVNRNKPPAICGCCKPVSPEEEEE